MHMYAVEYEMFFEPIIMALNFRRFLSDLDF